TKPTSTRRSLRASAPPCRCSVLPRSPPSAVPTTSVRAIACSAAPRTAASSPSMLPVDIRLAKYLSGGLHAGYRTMLDGFDRGLTGHLVHDPDAPLALQMCAPMVFAPVPGKRNVLV